MSDEFNQRAAQLALSDIERDLIQASRDFEDATRSQDEYLAADAMKRYAEHKKNYDELAGTGQQQQPSGQLSTAQVNFLSRRQAGGDHLDGKRMQDYARGHDRAVAAGLEPNSPQYFNAVSHYVDHLGDGRIPPLDEREAARISGISEQEYSAHAQRLRALKAAGHYRED